MAEAQRSITNKTLSGIGWQELPAGYHEISVIGSGKRLNAPRVVVEPAETIFHDS